MNEAASSKETYEWQPMGITNEGLGCERKAGKTVVEGGKDSLKFSD
jgi:hypothetical protein